jgi:hypothetical protein
MKTIRDVEVMSVMATRNLDIKAAPDLVSNVTASLGGHVTMGVDKATHQQLGLSGRHVAILYVIDWDQFSEVKKELQSEEAPEEFKKGWIFDQLPTEHRRYLCNAFLINCYVEAVCCFDLERKVWIYEHREVDVKGYMPLPPSPKELSTHKTQWP